MNANPAKAVTGSGATVYVVDDDVGVLEMLQAVIATIDAEVRPYASPEAFLEAYHPLPCECLVCDVRMPNIDGLGVQKRLVERGAIVPIIFLTGHAEVGSAVEAMKSGAFDFIEKPFATQALLSKIMQALERSRSLYAEWLMKKTAAARIALLTPKERGVAELVVSGKSSREIADLLDISVRTVENHRARIMDKLYAKTTVDLVKLFLG